DAFRSDHKDLRMCCKYYFFSTVVRIIPFEPVGFCHLLHPEKPIGTDFQEMKSDIAVRASFPTPVRTGFQVQHGRIQSRAHKPGPPTSDRTCLTSFNKKTMRGQST